MKDKILVIDYLNFVYRGLLDKRADKNIVFHFFRNIRALIGEMEPNKCFFVLEGNPKFRKELLPSYKQNRIVKISSVEIRQRVLDQANVICKLLSYLPVTTVKAENYEADDTIATLAAFLKEEDVVIVSSDSDLIQIKQNLSDCQLVNLYNPKSKEYIEAPQYSYVAWKSLAGDQADNVPGIVSKNKAIKLLANPEELKQFLAQEENKANFLLNKKIIELQIIPHNELIFCHVDKPNYDKLFEEFSKLEFFSLLQAKYKTKFIDTFQMYLE